MSSEAPKMKPTLGLTGLTMNAMALIAPGAFLWLTYAQQCQYGAPLAGSDMWFGIVAALALCFATAISYAEFAKLYPGAGSSYFFAEQAFLNHTKYFKFARPRGWVRTPSRRGARFALRARRRPARMWNGITNSGAVFASPPYHERGATCRRKRPR